MSGRLAARASGAREMKKLSLVVAMLAGCAGAPPSGPSILVLPGTGKNFDQFRVDEQECRGYARAQTDPNAIDESLLQRRYDTAFTQCMYARGHRVPVTGRYSDALPTTSASTSAARTPPPPPPPGQPPAEAPPDYRTQ